MNPLALLYAVGGKQLELLMSEVDLSEKKKHKRSRRSVNLHHSGELCEMYGLATLLPTSYFSPSSAVIFVILASNENKKKNEQKICMLGYEGCIFVADGTRRITNVNKNEFT